MNDMPQPSRSGSETRQRHSIIGFRATPDERAELEKAADNAGLSLSSYIRACVLQAPQTRARRRPPVNQAMLAQALATLGRAGGNLYQVSKRLNFGEPAAADVPGVLAEIRAAGAAIMEALGRVPRDNIGG